MVVTAAGALVTGDIMVGLDVTDGAVIDMGTGLS